MGWVLAWGMWWWEVNSVGLEQPHTYSLAGRSYEQHLTWGGFTQACSFLQGTFHILGTTDNFRLSLYLCIHSNSFPNSPLQSFLPGLQDLPLKSEGNPPWTRNTRILLASKTKSMQATQGSSTRSSVARPTLDHEESSFWLLDGWVKWNEPKVPFVKATFLYQGLQDFLADFRVSSTILSLYTVQYSSTPVKVANPFFDPKFTCGSFGPKYNLHNIFLYILL